jgi:multiple sugar transport system substrate-binding protein
MGNFTALVLFCICMISRNVFYNTARLHMNRLFASIIFVALLCLPAMAMAGEKLVIYGSFEEEQMQHPLVKDAIRDFERKHDIKLSFVMKTPLSSDELHEAYHRVLSAKSDVPDIMQIDVVRIPEFASMGYLVDLTNYITQSELDQFFPRSIDEVRWNKRLWAYPYFVAFGMILYRKDLMKDPPQTWNELIEIARKNQKDGLYGYVGQMALDEGFTCNVLEFLWSNGSDPQFIRGSRIFSARDVESLQLMVDIVNKYGLTPPDQLKFKEHEGMQLTKDGNIIFLRHWPQGIFKLKDYGRRSEERYAIMPIPRGPSGKMGYSSLGGWTMAINKHSKHKKVAIEFLKLFTSDKFQKHLALSLRKLPVKKALYKDPDVVKEYPWIEETFPLLVNAKNRPRSPYYPEISKIIQQEFHLALEGKISAKDAIDRAEKKIHAFFESTE